MTLGIALVGKPTFFLKRSIEPLSFMKPRWLLLLQLISGVWHSLCWKSLLVRFLFLTISLLLLASEECWTFVLEELFREKNCGSVITQSSLIYCFPMYTLSTVIVHWSRKFRKACFMVILLQKLWVGIYIGVSFNTCGSCLMYHLRDMLNRS